MVDKVWLKHYPKGVPAEIDYSAYRSIKHLFESCCEKFRDLPAYANFGVQMSYAELDRKTGHVTVWAREDDVDGVPGREYEDTPDGFGRIAATTARQVLLAHAPH